MTTPDWHPSDAAVEAAEQETDSWPEDAGFPWLPEGGRESAIRGILRAAYRVDAPRPLLDREAVEDLWPLIGDDEGERDFRNDLIDAVMELARPMPTRAELLDWVREIFDPEFKAPAYSEVAEKLLARLNGAES